MQPIYTIGYSTHELGAFLGLLTRNGITAIADVRSQPFSRLTHFNRDALEATLKACSIGYAFLGKELGARRDEPECYVNGQAVYERIAQLPVFRQGLDRLVKGAARYTIALMCAEREPLDCHRSVLICRHLRPLVPCIRHILADGQVEDHRQLEIRLLRLTGISPGQSELFAQAEELTEQAYEARGKQIAYRTSSEGAPECVRPPPRTLPDRSRSSPSGSPRRALRSSSGSFSRPE